MKDAIAIGTAIASIPASFWAMSIYLNYFAK